MRLIRCKLVVGALRWVPPGSRTLPGPLAAGFEPVSRKPPAAGRSIRANDEDAVDLREPTDLEPRRLLHRLDLFGVDWGTVTQGHRGRGRSRKRGWSPAA